MVRFLDIKSVCEATASGRSFIYKKIKDGEFPSPTKLGTRKSVWLSTEVEQWILDQAEGAQ